MRWLLMFAAGVWLAGCSGLGCDRAGYQSTMTPVLQRWDDALIVAERAPRVALRPEIEKLQAVRRDVQAVAAPECLQPAHDVLLFSLDQRIAGYLAFADNQDEGAIRVAFDAADTAMAQYRGMTEPAK